ncbi:MAG: hypothetical protein KAH25_08525, partial [Bacteroidales bacterium]|nr:hypothetical protein [Bacteroidales bacterium]
KQMTFDREKKIFLITWAQNNTPVHTEFLKNLIAYKDYLDGELHVIAGRYKNPTSVFNDEDETWAKQVLPFLDANKHDIHEYMSVMSDVKIQPTAVNPLTGLAGLSGINSCVFGSPKMQLEVIPALEGHRPKIMATTGACTLKNYTDSKAGKKGEFHHTLGFVIVEIDGSETFIRQVTATDTGSFTDLSFNCTNGKITKDMEIEALIMGDIHLGETDYNVMAATIDILDKFNPEHLVLHDLFDGHSISHHDSKDPIKQYHKEMAGTNVLKTEINEMLRWVGDMKELVPKLVVVRSNHDDFVDRWIINADWKSNIKNAMEYMEYTKPLLANEAPQGIIPWILNQEHPEVITLGRDSSYLILDWECGQHADIGANGARGSVNTFRKLNTKMIGGHSHQPVRKDGYMSVGTSTELRVGYNMGPSSWMNAHIMIHKDAKAQHIIFGPDGKYTTLI